MKVLVIEDDPSLREIICRSLEKERYVTEEAPDFQTALEKTADYTYDCILLDIMLPDGNGLDLLEELKKAVKEQHIKDPSQCKELLINSIPIAAGIAGKYCFFKKLGFEKDYVAGVLEGIKTVKKTRKVPYRKEDFHNYLAIEWELIYGAALYIYEFSRRQIRKKMAGPAKS